MKQEREPVGTCFLQDGTKTVEYAPCRSSMYEKLNLPLVREPRSLVFVWDACVCLYDKSCSPMATSQLRLTEQNDLTLLIPRNYKCKLTMFIVSKNSVWSSLICDNYYRILEIGYVQSQLVKRHL